MDGQDRTVEQILAEIGGRAHAIVTFRALLEASVSEEEILGRVRKGLLHREYRGVYSVGHPAETVEAHYMAAVLACGEGALLSGLAAAHLWGLVRGKPPGPEVTTLTERRVEGIATHRSLVIARRFAATFKGVPVTTVARTLVDIAAALDQDELARACHEAGVPTERRRGTSKRRSARRPRAARS